MDFDEIFNTYKELKEKLILKKDAIIHKKLENLNSLDEDIVVLCERISKFDIESFTKTFTDEQKQELKNIGAEIKNLEENNEILIQHSLDVINGILSGILNIVDNDSTYNSSGKSLSNKNLDISSITEEA